MAAPGARSQPLPILLLLLSAVLNSHPVVAHAQLPVHTPSSPSPSVAAAAATPSVANLSSHQLSIPLSNGTTTTYVALAADPHAVLLSTAALTLEQSPEEVVRLIEAMSTLVHVQNTSIQRLVNLVSQQHETMVHLQAQLSTTITATSQMQAQHNLPPSSILAISPSASKGGSSLPPSSSSSSSSSSPSSSSSSKSAAVQNARLVVASSAAAPTTAPPAPPSSPLATTLFALASLSSPSIARTSSSSLPVSPSSPSPSSSPTSPSSLSLASSVAASVLLQVVLQHPPEPVQQVVVGQSHTCVIMSRTRGVRCWGYNHAGELGDGTQTDRWVPPAEDVQVDGEVLQISAGGYHTCIILNASLAVKCWGYSEHGETGTGEVADVLSPPSKDVLRGALQISAGTYHNCALVRHKVAHASASSSSSSSSSAGAKKTGSRTTPSASSPSSTGSSSLPNSKAAPSSGEHTEEHGDVVNGYGGGNEGGGVTCWGKNAHGELGLSPDLVPFLLKPAEDFVLDNVVQLAAGEEHTCALMKLTRGVRCWGGGAKGQLGTGGTHSLHAPPSTDIIAGILHIAAGSSHTCVVVAENRGLRCYGANDYGQLGRVTETAVLSPPHEDVVTGVIQVAAGYRHTCVLLSGIEGVHCYGYDYFGKGHNSADSTAAAAAAGSGGRAGRAAADKSTTIKASASSAGSPTHPSEPSSSPSSTLLKHKPGAAPVLRDVLRLAIGGSSFHSCALASGKTGLYCWGNNGYGQLGYGQQLANTTDLPSPLAVAISFE